MRLDKFLKVSRVIKRRTVANEAADSGRISVNGKVVKPMVSSMDHKRAHDNDEGLNTGGMGTIAPNPYYTKDIADIFIVSQAYIADSAPAEVLNEYTEEGITVWVVKAKGEKCSRCWKYRELNSNGICTDCAEAVGE